MLHLPPLSILNFFEYALRLLFMIDNSHLENLLMLFKRREENSYGLSVVFHVAKGLRPIIPFSTTQEEWTREFILDHNLKSSNETLKTFLHVENEYFRIMQECWNAIPECCPSFLTIIKC